MMRSMKLRMFVAAMVMIIFSAGIIYAEGVDKININTATAEELVQLKRVGPKYAARIVAFREQNGPFKAPEDIMQVGGIGEKTFEENKDKIVVK